MTSTAYAVLESIKRGNLTVPEISDDLGIPSGRVDRTLRVILTREKCVARAGVQHIPRGRPAVLWALTDAGKEAAS